MVEHKTAHKCDNAGDQAELQPVPFSGTGITTTGDGWFQLNRVYESCRVRGVASVSPDLSVSVKSSVRKPDANCWYYITGDLSPTREFDFYNQDIIVTRRDGELVFCLVRDGKVCQDDTDKGGKSGKGRSYISSACYSDIDRALVESAIGLYLDSQGKRKAQKGQEEQQQAQQPVHALLSVRTAEVRPFPPSGFDKPWLVCDRTQRRARLGHVMESCRVAGVAAIHNDSVLVDEVSVASLNAECWFYVRGNYCYSGHDVGIGIVVAYHDGLVYRPVVNGRVAGAIDVTAFSLYDFSELDGMLVQAAIRHYIAKL